ncbi:hypothetical protein BDV96DRAFT_618030 [Lophiotrema nucula]|uniref:WSC domain-containing protein n=1 Tax=Lophiotrema nucula TaxID=690887 RepID=A0A6A5ZTT1_9PLEO|nr:hypothetical protein BDV96DRAFT_618030 [Lophiotrema nucula]
MPRAAYVAGHLHTISGGSGFGPKMTFQQARASRCSSCTIKEDMSNYWTPQLYFQAQNGSFIPVPVAGDGDDTNGGMTVYYLQRPGSPNEKLYGFPEGFRMLAGDSSKRNFTGGLDAKAVSFNCLGSNKAETNSMPKYNCPGGLRAQIFFPSCWDGIHLDSANHKSHMSYFSGTEYNTGVCPSTHPVHTISIFFEILYDTDRFKDQWYGNQQPFVFSNGDNTGYGFHGDFVNGWDVRVLQKAVDTCTSDSGQVERCPAVTQFTATEYKACKIPAIVNEQSDGWTKTLPGCNPVTSGPEPAKPVAGCPAASIGSPIPNYVDLTSSRRWSYAGCGTDGPSQRTLSGASTTSLDMTVEKCVDFCSAKGFRYAGVEYRNECYCDNKLGADRAPQPGIYGNCNMKCAGNDRELCGGPGALSIYQKCTDSSCKNYQFNAQASS